MVCPHVATVNWHKSLQFVKKSNIALLPCLFMILLAVWIIILGRSITFGQEPRFCVVFSPPPFIYIYIYNINNWYWHKWMFSINIFIYFELKILEYMLFSVTNRCFSGRKAVKNGLLLQRYWNLQYSDRRVMLWE